MRFLPIYLTLVHFLAGPNTVSSEKTELCEALVIRECSGHSRGLLKVIESGNKHLFNKNCDALQVSDSDCLHESDFCTHCMRYYITEGKDILKKIQPKFPSSSSLRKTSQHHSSTTSVCTIVINFCVCCNKKETEKSLFKTGLAHPIGVSSDRLQCVKDYFNIILLI